VVGDARGEAIGDAAFRQRRCRNGAIGRRLYGAGAWREQGTWQPRGESALTGGPNAERGRLTGGSLVSVISELKFTPGRK
jgi:hypothetical protein